MDKTSKKNNALVLIVDDEVGARDALEIVLEDYYKVATTESGQKALDAIRLGGIDLVLLDLNMPDMDGIEVLKRIKNLDNNVEVIMVSAIDSAAKAVDAMKLGAYDYITKPFEPDDIIMSVGRALERQRLKKEVEYLKQELAYKSKQYKIVTRNKKMLDVIELVKKVAHTSSNVLIYGESGTGKELIARAIHENGERKNAPFVPVNCGAIPVTLMETEFFGHEKGAFTGANKTKLGKFEFADGGTIFLDEVSTLPPLLQVKLLRVLQEKKIERVGSNTFIKVDIRIIAATNTDLKEEVAKKRFRNDLYYRLNVVPINIPPLRERRNDIPYLIDYFLKNFNKAFHKKIKGFSTDALEVLTNYNWPGNVRELENIIERMVVLGRDNEQVTLKEIPVEVFTTDNETSIKESGLRDACRMFERKLILKCLKKTDWNQTKTAQLLKIHRNTLITKLRELDIDFDEHTTQIPR